MPNNSTSSSHDEIMDDGRFKVNVEGSSSEANNTAMIDESDGEIVGDQMTNNSHDDTIQSALLPSVGEPFTKYLVGFGRNSFGRFSLTAALNEKTGKIVTRNVKS